MRKNEKQSKREGIDAVLPSHWNATLLPQKANPVNPPPTPRLPPPSQERNHPIYTTHSTTLQFTHCSILSSPPIILLPLIANSLIGLFHIHPMINHCKVKPVINNDNNKNNKFVLLGHSELKRK